MNKSNFLKMNSRGRNKLDDIFSIYFSFKKKTSFESCKYIVDMGCTKVIAKVYELCMTEKSIRREQSLDYAGQLEKKFPGKIDVWLKLTVLRKAIENDDPEVIEILKNSFIEALELLPTKRGEGLKNSAKEITAVFSLSVRMRDLFDLFSAKFDYFLGSCYQCNPTVEVTKSIYYIISRTLKNCRIEIFFSGEGLSVQKRFLDQYKQRCLRLFVSLNIILLVMGGLSYGEEVLILESDRRAILARAFDPGFTRDSYELFLDTYGDELKNYIRENAVKKLANDEIIGFVPILMDRELITFKDLEKIETKDLSVRSLKILSKHHPNEDYFKDAIESRNIWDRPRETDDPFDNCLKCIEHHQNEYLKDLLEGNLKVTEYKRLFKTAAKYLNDEAMDMIYEKFPLDIEYYLQMSVLYSPSGVVDKFYMRLRGD